MIDHLVLAGFFLLSILIGFIPSLRKTDDSGEYHIAGRSVSLPVFIMTNVATWYGGILGVGEFSYRYGLLNWFTQGAPYYLFAIILALFLVGRIKSSASLTIPDAVAQVYGKYTSIVIAVFVFLLTSPAPYFLMTGLIISHLIHIPLLVSLVFVLISTLVYFYWGGYRSDLTTDIFYFFVMFIGFALVLYFLNAQYGGLQFISSRVPPSHLRLTGDVSISFIAVWWLIAIWTFADPGFFQRIQAARTLNTAKWGILISVLFWFAFDFLTNALGLYGRALFPNLKNPAEVFFLLADQQLFTGMRGIFYAAMFATILSTFNSMLFISGTTFAHDIIGRMKNENDPKIAATQKGMIISGIISIGICLLIPSVIGIWYALGSLCIPSMALILLSTYFPKFKIPAPYAVAEIITTFFSGSVWWFLRAQKLLGGSLIEIEPMIVGLGTAIIFHVLTLLRFNKNHVNG